jgi:hypothetical protein
VGSDVVDHALARGKMIPVRRVFSALLLIFLVCTGQVGAKNMNAAPRIDELFEKTKPVCFGRFLIDVPADAEALFGPQAFWSYIKNLENGSKKLKSIAIKKREEIVAASRTIEKAEMDSFYEEPYPGSWTISFWESDSAKEVGVEDVWAYLSAPPHGFMMNSSTANSEGRTLDVIKKRLRYVATNLRARQPDEVPAEPGVCLDLGFIKDDSGKFQEEFSIGFRFPSLPDVSFSISSNKDARRDSTFEERRSEAKKAAMMFAPLATLFSKVKTLREGHHKVSKWMGEEALFRRPLEDEKGVWHEFQFEYPGVRYDHHNPGWDAALFTGVKKDRAGSQASSLSDEEAIALWDWMLSTMRLRVEN